METAERTKQSERVQISTSVRRAFPIKRIDISEPPGDSVHLITEMIPRTHPSISLDHTQQTPVLTLQRTDHCHIYQKQKPKDHPTKKAIDLNKFDFAQLVDTSFQKSTIQQANPSIVSQTDEEMISFAMPLPKSSKIQHYQLIQRKLELSKRKGNEFGSMQPSTANTRQKSIYSIQDIQSVEKTIRMNERIAK